MKYKVITVGTINEFESFKDALTLIRVFIRTGVKSTLLSNGNIIWVG